MGSGRSPPGAPPPWTSCSCTSPLGQALRDAGNVPGGPDAQGELGGGQSGGLPKAGIEWPDAVVAAASSRSLRTAAAELGRRAPISYRERTSPAEAALDAAILLTIFGTPVEPGAGGYQFTLRPSDGELFHIRRFAARPLELTALLPIVESFGLSVAESVPFRFELRPGVPVCIDDIGVHQRAVPASAVGSHEASPPRFDPARDGLLLLDALRAVVDGRAEVDRLNALVTGAALEWRHVALLRAYANYWAQCAPSVPSSDVEEALVGFPAVSRAIVSYFSARFDPAQRSQGAEAAARSACGVELARVPILRWDRALRVALQLVDATVRTNFFQSDAHGRSARTVTLKIESASVPNLRPPHPRVETWVHSPEIEGIHLRAGLVARGGIRWSERPEDFRTEVLDLMVAQVKKNAIIVPTGAKGGFVLRGTPDPSLDGVRDAYATFVSSLLAVTDDLRSGTVVDSPSGVVAHDGPDPYLVVAADKGTADFSDLANEISESQGFWLGDAFASGGSHGYNHKTMGITAKGAWVAVRRHFHQLGIDVQAESILLAGVGDMSGDVFGNGMLCSSAVRLIAAFDHRHIFLDPQPVPAVSFAERARLASLPRSSWADYSSALISEGGGVWARDVKEVPISPAARRVLGTERERMSPPELISAILEAPVDLLWFGGVGTFVKEAGEHDSAVGDHTNDEVRVTADRLRTRVIAEGGNLGLTQQARIRYSRRGGRINADFIDNAGGVATSDREVNLKILLALAIKEGRLSSAERDSYLHQAQEEVAAAVLRQVDHSVAALNRAVPESAGELDAFVALIDLLEAAGRFDRTVEALPSADELALRRDAGAGMIRPELAVLMAYAKSDLGAAVETATYVRDACLSGAVERYFPARMREDFGDLLANHRLYDQILATEVAGEIVDQLGIVWAHETAAELGRPLADSVAAYWAAREVVGASASWSELDSRWSALPADADAELHRRMSAAVRDLARTYLRRGAALVPHALIAEDLVVADGLSAAVPEDGGIGELTVLGVDADTADRWLRTTARAAAGDVGSVGRATGRDVPAVVAAFRIVDAAAGVDRIAGALRGATMGGRWRSWLARAMLDDLSDWRRQAAVGVLREAGTPAGPALGWAKRHDRDLTAARDLLHALDEPGTDPVAVVAIALRRLPRYDGTDAIA